jgi:CheY-like chemotaxis protein
MEKFDILVVDDSESDADFFRATLSEIQPAAKMHWLPGGEEAIAYLTRSGENGSSPIKLLVLDINMPGLTGLETLRRIKRIPQLANLPVVIFSGSKTRREIDLAYSAGANGFFTKPTLLSDYNQLVGVLVQYWLRHAALPSIAIA